MSNNKAFTERESSFFIVETPFQTMCAINAIRQLKIDHYILSIHLHKNTVKRNDQTIEILKMYGLDYIVIQQQAISLFRRLGLFFYRKGGFNRVFLGTHLYQDGYYFAIKAINNGGDIVLLDDGIATLGLLNNDYKVTGRSILYNALFRIIAFLRKINMNNVLTVYKGVENKKWNIAFNDISNLRQSNLTNISNIVFFIGTNNSGFINKYDVNESDLQQKLYTVICNVKALFPYNEIVYVPHGRDKSSIANEICSSIGIEFRPLDVNVEIYLLSMGIVPKAILGFTSSALYNLKMIFPETSVNNILIDLFSNITPSLIETSYYYEKFGIKTLKM